MLRRPIARPWAIDAWLYHLAPPLLLTAAVLALAMVPWTPEFRGLDFNTGAILFSAALAYVTPAILMAGWASGRTAGVVGGFRFLALMLAYEMPFAITIIAVALPAEPLALGEIVAWQHEVIWNVLLQPVGFLIYLVSALAVALSGPFELIGSSDLAGGAELELGGAPLLVWRFAHYALLLATSAFAVPLFLGGGAGPLLPDLAWTVLKVLLLASLLVLVGHACVRLRLDWFMKVAWVVLIPLALVNLFVVGLLMLLFPGFFAGRP